VLRWAGLGWLCWAGLVGWLAGWLVGWLAGLGCFAGWLVNGNLHMVIGN